MAVGCHLPSRQPRSGRCKQEPLAEGGREASASHEEQKHSVRCLQVPRHTGGQADRSVVREGRGGDPRGHKGLRARTPGLLPFSLSLGSRLSHGNIHKAAILLSLPILGTVPTTARLQWLNIFPGVFAPVTREHCQVKRGTQVRCQQHPW